MSLRTTLVLTAGCLFITASPATSQKNPEPAPRPAERHMRVGLGAVAGTAGLGGAIDVSLDARGRLYRGRLSLHDNAIGELGGSQRERVTVVEAALMVGRGRRYRRNYGSLAVGLGLVNLDGHRDGRSTTTLGVPMEAQLISGGPLRLGATMMGNLNVERPVAAFILSVQLGSVP